MRVKNLVSLVAVGLAEVLVIELLNGRVLMRLAQIRIYVVVVKNGGANGTKVNGLANNCGLVRLSTAVYTTAGTCHDLDELNVKLACLNSIKNLLSICSTGSNSNSDFVTSNCVGSFLDAFNASYLIEFEVSKLFTCKCFVSSSESSFHNTAGSTEDCTCT